MVQFIGELFGLFDELTDKYDARLITLFKDLCKIVEGKTFICSFTSLYQIYQRSCSQT